MDTTNEQDAPDWAARFLDALRTGKGVREACRAAGVGSSAPYHLRDRDDGFRAQWDAIPVADGRTKRKTGPRAPRDAGRIDQFLDELAISSNVAAAASVAGIPTSKVYALRRTDPDFARRWYVALAEGYDNLEMELLARLRGGEEAGSAADKRKFDTATALRCLTAHRESVAREKGRRTLADEVATIEAINAKIDAMRARAREGDKAMRAARKAAAQRTRRDGEA